MGNFRRRLESAQLIGVGKLVEAFQAEELEEERSCLVEERTAGLLRAARDADDFALEEGGDDAIDGHAAY